MTNTQKSERRFMTPALILKIFEYVKIKIILALRHGYWLGTRCFDQFNCRLMCAYILHFSKNPKKTKKQPKLVWTHYAQFFKNTIEIFSSFHDIITHVVNTKLSYGFKTAVVMLL